MIRFHSAPRLSGSRLTFNRNERLSTFHALQQPPAVPHIQLYIYRCRSRLVSFISLLVIYYQSYLYSKLSGFLSLHAASRPFILSI